MCVWLRGCSFALGLIAVALAADRPAQADKAAPPKAAEAFTLSKEEQEILDLTNKEREKESLPPLKANEKLFRAARDHSANMAKQEKMDHILDEKDPVDRAKAVGYIHRALAENVAHGQKNAAGAVDAWMKSDGHKKNILGKDYAEIGIGIAKSEKGLIYYTQVFGTRLKR